METGLVYGSRLLPAFDEMSNCNLSLFEMWLKTKQNGESSRLDLNLFVCVCVLYMQQMHNGELFLSIHKFNLIGFWCNVVM